MVCPASLVLLIFKTVSGPHVIILCKSVPRTVAARAGLCAGLLDGLPSGQEGEDLLELEEQVKTQGARVKQSKNSNAEVRHPVLLTSMQCTSDFNQVTRSTSAGIARHRHECD